MSRKLDGLHRTLAEASRATCVVIEGLEQRTLLAGTGSGLLAEYYDNADHNSLKVVRQDASVEFNWSTGSPAAGVASDTFSVRWTGQVMPQYSQTYTFRVSADDGARLWVNNVAIIANYTASGSGSIALTAGRKYDIRLEMRENTGNASVKLQWSSPSQPLQVIPTNRLFRQTATAYYDKLKSSLASTYGLPSNPTNLIGDNEDSVVETRPRAVSSMVPNPITITPIDVAHGNPAGFLRAVRATSTATSRLEWMDQVVIGASNSFAQGDRLLGSFWIRGSNFETGTKGYVQALIYHGQNVYASRYIEVDGTWRQYFLRGQASAAGSATSSFGLQFLTGFQTQAIEVGGAAILNYRTTAALSQLPATTPINYDYDGRRVNGVGSPQWYVDAQARIEQHRKANLNVTVRNSAGQPVNGATVQFKMRQHSFGWGSQALAYDLYMRSDRSQTMRTFEDMYRDGTNKRLNAVVQGDLKWNYELTPETMSAAQWFRDRGIKPLGHTLMWGDKSSIPAGQDNLTAIRNRITTAARRYAGTLEGFDVLNETFGRRTWETQLGYSGFVNEVKTWFNLAQSQDPTYKLWLNDNNILSGSGLNKNRIDYYVKFIKDLKAAGAPVYGMGMQSHFGNDGQRHFTAPSQVYANLNTLAATGVKLRVSEFDMYNGASNDYFADYMRDFMTVVFSHPSVESFYSWGMSDSNHWQNNGPWYDSNWNLKPAGKAFLDTIFSTWWTDTSRVTNTSGAASVRGFKGLYDIVVTVGGVTTVFSANLKNDQSLTLTLPSSAVPSAPVNLNAVRSSATQIYLSWDHVSTTETGYSIERSTNGTSFSVIGTTAANVLIFKDNGLSPDTRYFYRVRAIGSGGAGAYSNIDDARTNAAGTNTISGTLFNDANGNGVKDAGEANLSGWTVFVDDNLNRKFDPWENSRMTDASGNYQFTQILYGNYQIGQQLQPGWTRTTATEIYTGSVTNNQAVAGRNWGNRFSGASTTPAAATGLVATAASAGQINLSWSDRSSNETGFEIDVSTSSTFASGVTTRLAAVNATSFNVTGLAGSTTYYFRVRATNAAGDSANSNTATARTPTPVTAPTPTPTPTPPPPTSALPSPWSRSDIGAVSSPGTASQSGGVWTLASSGVDTATANALNFVHVKLTGDGSITARVASVQDNEPYARAGVMMRETLAAGSKYASMNMYATKGSISNWRSATGGAFGVSNSGGVTQLPPYWVRVTRSGNTFTMARSADGHTWATVGVPQTISMTSTIYVGLIVSSNNTSKTTSSTLSNVTVVGNVSKS
jgi:endo-1,4-beta-xylanase